jgi:hypothetical protein
MGQYANQPDFITNDIQPVSPVAAASLTAADSLNGSVLYIGSTPPGSSIQVIPAGRVGPSVVTGLSSIGVAGSMGSGYTTATAVPTLGGSTGSSGLKVDIVADTVTQVITSITINDPGTGYKNGDTVTVNQSPTAQNAVFRVVASPGLPGIAQAQIFVNPPQGEWFPVVVDYVLSDSTTVTDIIAGK